MYLPAVHDERTTLVNYLDSQLEALRASVHGLTDEQARRTPLRSQLSLAGIIKHINYCMNGSLVGAGLRQQEEHTYDQPGSFHLTDGETLESELAHFDVLREEYLAMCRDGDLDAVLPAGPMPWYGIDEKRDVKLRYLYVHHVEEFARHAGHADLIREEIDGAQAPELLVALGVIVENDYVKKWTPEPSA